MLQIVLAGNELGLGRSLKVVKVMGAFLTLLDNILFLRSFLQTSRSVLRRLVQPAGTLLKFTKQKKIKQPTLALTCSKRDELNLAQPKRA